jgi:hypothetical protein
MMRRQRWLLLAVFGGTGAVAFVSAVGEFDGSGGSVVLEAISTIAILWASAAAVATLWEMQDSKEEDRLPRLQLYLETVPVRGLPRETVVVRNLGRASARDLGVTSWWMEADGLEYVPHWPEDVPAELGPGQAAKVESGRSTFTTGAGEEGGLVVELSYSDGIGRLVHYFEFFAFELGPSDGASPRRVTGFDLKSGAKVQGARQQVRDLEVKLGLDERGLILRVEDDVVRIRTELVSPDGDVHLLMSAPKARPLYELLAGTESECRRILREDHPGGEVPSIRW